MLRSNSLVTDAPPTARGYTDREIHWLYAEEINRGGGIKKARRSDGLQGQNIQQEDRYDAHFCHSILYDGWPTTEVEDAEYLAKFNARVVEIKALG